MRDIRLISQINHIHPTYIPNHNFLFTKKSWTGLLVMKLLGWPSSASSTWRRLAAVCLGCGVETLYPKMSGDISQPALTTVHNGTVWLAALLDLFRCTCLDVSRDALAGGDSDKSICLHMLRGTLHVLHVVPHTQSSKDTHWQDSSKPGCQHRSQGH